MSQVTKHVFFFYRIICGARKRSLFKRLYFLKTLKLTWLILWRFSNWYFATRTGRRERQLLIRSLSSNESLLSETTSFIKELFARRFATRSTVRFAIKPGKMRIPKRWLAAGCSWVFACQRFHRHLYSISICSSELLSSLNLLGRNWNVVVW